MEGYASNQANRSFVTFFLLNARLLLSMRLNFYSKRFLTDEHVEQQKKKFQVDKWASKRARLLFTTSCSHPEIIFLHRMLILWIRPIHLFVTAKKSGWVRCYCHVQSGFCLKIWWTINPWAFCTICKLELHVVALVLPSTCHYTAASSMAAVRSRPRPCRRSPPWLARCARRRLALSTWSTTKRNQEMTVRGEADSRDPPGSLHFASRCLVITSQKNTSS